MSASLNAHNANTIIGLYSSTWTIKPSQQYVATMTVYTSIIFFPRCFFVQGGGASVATPPAPNVIVFSPSLTLAVGAGYRLSVLFDEW